MKQLFFAILVIASLSLVGCRSSKPSAIDGEVAIKLDECITLQQQAPERRAWGEGIGYTINDAQAQAQAAARANFASMIESAVESGTDHFAQKYSKASSDGENGALVSDYTGLDKNFYSAVAKQVVKNTQLKKSSPYKLKDGQYHVYVCIEYNGSIADLAGSVASNVNNQLSDDDKLRLQFDYNQYKNEIEETLRNQNQK